MTERASALLALWNDVTPALDAVASQAHADAALGKLSVFVFSSALRGERVHDASPLPWLRCGQDKAVEGEALLCLPGSALDSEEAAHRLVNAVVYARLAVGACL